MDTTPPNSPLALDEPTAAPLAPPVPAVTPVPLPSLRSLPHQAPQRTLPPDPFLTPAEPPLAPLALPAETDLAPSPPPPVPSPAPVPAPEAEEARGCLYALSQPPLMFFLAFIAVLFAITGAHDLFLL
ncbi:hypothetical protein [Streptomyces daliensis]|uniref:Uncharacterized protein n=1 Tax=Streptomyces daliensis TaxID=299421 RepID=A0A8T4IX02_9ACTN|nr:hypothetical protein [Streptomyces daliensis]